MFLNRYEERSRQQRCRFHPSGVAAHSCDLELEVVDLRHPAGGMHGEIGCEYLFTAICPRTDLEGWAVALDRSDLGPQTNLDAELSRCLDQAMCANSKAM